MKRPIKLTLSLPVELTSKETIGKAMELTSLDVEYDRVETEKAEVNKAYNAQLKALRAKQLTIARLLSTATEDRKPLEDRPIECVVHFHSPHVGMKTTVRLDTGETVTSEPMTDDERQENLFEETEAVANG